MLLLARKLLMLLMLIRAFSGIGKNRKPVFGGLSKNQCKALFSRSQLTSYVHWKEDPIAFPGLGIYVVELSRKCYEMNCHFYLQSFARNSDLYHATHMYGYIDQRHVHMITSVSHMQELSLVSLSSVSPTVQFPNQSCLRNDMLIVGYSVLNYHYKISAYILTIIDKVDHLRIVLISSTLMDVFMKRMGLFIASVADLVNVTLVVLDSSIIVSNIPVSHGDNTDDTRLRNDTVGPVGLVRILHYVSHDPQVLWIEYYDPHPMLSTLDESVSDQAIRCPGEHRGGDVEQYHYASEVNGNNEIIGIIDTGLDIHSCYFHDDKYVNESEGYVEDRWMHPHFPYNEVVSDHCKVVYYGTAHGDGVDNAEHGYHGTHVCGIAAGKRSATFVSHAPGAKLAIWDASTSMHELHISSLYRVLRRLYDIGARIFSNSWCNSINISYNYNAREVDMFMHDYPEALVLFAAGNEGPDRGSVGSPGSNKNGLTVGSYGSNRSAAGNGGTVYGWEDVSEFSSRGPTLDGRLKPEVLGPGHNIWSAMGNTSSLIHCQVQQKSGTSMACPAIAGNAAVIREYFRTGYYPTGMRHRSDEFIPSGALIKAMLIHSTSAYFLPLNNNETATEEVYHKDANDGHGRNGSHASNSIWFDTGFGRVQIHKVLYFTNSLINNAPPLWIIGAAYEDHPLYKSFLLTDSKYHYYDVYPSNNDTSIRITLVYTDIPPSILAGTVLVNQLDICVTNMYTNITYHPMKRVFDGSPIKMIQLQQDEHTTISSQHYRLSVIATELVCEQSYALIVTCNMDNYFKQSIKPQSKVPAIPGDPHSQYITSMTLYSLFIIIVSICLLIY